MMHIQSKVCDVICRNVALKQAIKLLPVNWLFNVSVIEAKVIYLESAPQGLCIMTLYESIYLQKTYVLNNSNYK